jgi:hypothetical protein
MERHVRRLLILIFVLLVPQTVYAQSNVQISLGVPYANGSLTIQRLPQALGFVETRHVFLGANGDTFLSGLTPGSIYGFRVVKSASSGQLYAEILINGAPQDISATLLASVIGVGTGTPPAIISSTIAALCVPVAGQDAVEVGCPGGPQVSVNGGPLKPLGNLRVDVTAYGAIGDGVTDDRAAIQAAATAAGLICGQLYIPAGYTFLINSNPQAGQTQQPIIFLPGCVGMSGTGTIKIGTISQWDSVFQYQTPSSVTVTPVVFRDFTLDLNGTGNPLTSSPGLTNEHTGFVLGTNLPLHGSAGITLDSVSFKNGNGVWAVTANGVNDVTVTNCKFLNWGVGGSFVFDHSVMYLAGIGITVANNQMYGAGALVNTGIEVHGANISVTGNTIWHFANGIIYVPDVAESVGAGNTPTDVTISGNSLYVSSVGIDPSTDASGGFNNLTVEANSITVDRNLTTLGIVQIGQQSGIMFIANSNPANGVNIHGNTIEFIHETASYTSISGLGCIFVFNQKAISNLQIESNVCFNSSGAGVLILGSGASATLAGAAIQNNTVINCGQASALNSAYRDGIYISSEQKWYGSVIKNNTITDNQVTHTMATGMLWGGITGDLAPTQVVMERNRIRYFDVSPGTILSVITTSPYVDLDIPNFFPSNWVLGAGIPNSDNPPIGSVVHDSVTGGDYRLTAQNSTGGAFTIFGNIASGTATMTTAAIAAGACGTPVSGTFVTGSNANILATDTITWSFNAAPGANPASIPVSTWPVALSSVNFQYCIPAGATGVTPTAATLNWKVMR